MASLNGNSAYLTINGTSMGAYYTKIDFKGTAESVDITHGSGATHVMRAPGLKDVKATLTLAYEVGSVSTQLGLIAPGGTFTVIYGPESNTAGKPKHEQSFIFPATDFSQEVTKPLVVFNIEIEGAAAPVTDLWAGGTF